MAENKSQARDSAGNDGGQSQMDKIDEIIDALAKDLPLPERKGKLKDFESWDPDKLEEELKKHPFFMTEMPKEGEPLPPLIEAFQQLKYSKDDNTPNELARNYKEDGLFHFKLKKYRIATTCFSEAIRSAENEMNEEPDAVLTSQLYNNRAAAQFHVGNFRSAIQDCDKALCLNPGYTKPLMKALECCVKLEKWDKALEYCDIGDKMIPRNAEIEKIRKTALFKLKMEKAFERGAIQKEKVAKIEKDSLMAMLRDRRLKCMNENFLSEEAAASGKKVHVVDEGKLEWPVLFYYPQHSTSDFIENFHEDSKFVDHLAEILDNDRPAWDKDKEYDSTSVDAYFVDTQTGSYIQFDIQSTLGEVMKHASYYLPTNGVPGFFIMARENEMCKVLVERCQ